MQRHRSHVRTSWNKSSLHTVMYSTCLLTRPPTDRQTAVRLAVSDARPRLMYLYVGLTTALLYKMCIAYVMHTHSATNWATYNENFLQSSSALGLPWCPDNMHDGWDTFFDHCDLSLYAPRGGQRQRCNDKTACGSNYYLHCHPYHIDLWRMHAL